MAFEATQRRSAEECARGALKATHAAASLARPSKEVWALLQSAEGLIRAAVAQLRQQGHTHASGLGGGPGAPRGQCGDDGDADRRRDKRREKRIRQKDKKKKENGESEGLGPLPGGAAGSLMLAQASSAPAPSTSASSRWMAVDMVGEAPAAAALTTIDHTPQQPNRVLPDRESGMKQFAEFLDGLDGAKLRAAATKYGLSSKGSPAALRKRMSSHASKLDWSCPGDG